MRLLFAIDLELKRCDGDSRTSRLIVTVCPRASLLGDFCVVLPHDASHGVLGRAEQLRHVGSDDRNNRRVGSKVAVRAVVILRAWHPKLDDESERWREERPTVHRDGCGDLDRLAPHFRFFSARVNDNNLPRPFVSERVLRASGRGNAERDEVEARRRIERHGADCTAARTLRRLRRVRAVKDSLTVQKNDRRRKDINGSGRGGFRGAYHSRTRLP